MSPNPFEVALLATRALEELAIPYAIVGSAASTLHGEPRATLDIDLNLRLRSSEVEPLCRRLASEFFLDAAALRESVRTGLPCNAIHRVHHVKLDLYVRPDDGHPATERRRARRMRLTKAPGSEAFVASPEDTLLYKLVWFRKAGESSDRQWRDVVGILKAQGERLERDYLREWGASLGVLDLVRRAANECGLERLEL